MFLSMALKQEINPVDAFLHHNPGVRYYVMPPFSTAHTSSFYAGL